MIVEFIYDLVDDWFFATARMKRESLESLKEPKKMKGTITFNSIFESEEREQKYYKKAGLIDGDKLEKEPY
ncbi:MAG: hypothetical protein MI810_01955 [Flavobacteriales bacterium]|nr:hypothetical protein [Flavobacteriales bacterium]